MCPRKKVGMHQLTLQPKGGYSNKFKRKRNMKRSREMAKSVANFAVRNDRLKIRDGICDFRLKLSRRSSTPNLAAGDLGEGGVHKQQGVCSPTFAV